MSRALEGTATWSEQYEVSSLDFWLLRRLERRDTTQGVELWNWELWNWSCTEGFIELERLARREKGRFWFQMFWKDDFPVHRPREKCRCSSRVHVLFVPFPAPSFFSLNVRQLKAVIWWALAVPSPGPACCCTPARQGKQGDVPLSPEGLVWPAGRNVVVLGLLNKSVVGVLKYNG